jgi:Prophage protein (DUF1660)
MNWILRLICKLRGHDWFDIPHDDNVLRRICTRCGAVPSPPNA